MLNCDQVFDVLTRGPFPTGAPSDAGVEAHLDDCAECRRLAEALRPAIELFEEAVLPEESEGLPGYRGVNLPEAHYDAAWATAPRPAARPPRLSTSARPRVVHRSQGDLLRLALALAVGVALGSALLGPESQRSRRLDVTWASFEARTQELPQAMVVSLRLADACRPPRPWLALGGGPELSTSDDSVRLACCTLCHTIEGEAAAAQVAISHLASSCQVCHTN